jgi:threonine/homoserine/homoserine lactone efflux protein
LLSELIPLALVVAFSPLSIIPAVVLVLHTDRPQPTGRAFMAGWLAGLAALTAVFVQVPHLVDGLDQESPRWAPWVRIVIGVLLIVLAVGRWMTRNRDTRPPALLSRLSRITAIGAAFVGFVLSVANPKVLVMNAGGRIDHRHGRGRCRRMDRCCLLHRSCRLDGGRPNTGVRGGR